MCCLVSCACRCRPSSAEISSLFLPYRSRLDLLAIRSMSRTYRQWQSPKESSLVPAGSSNQTVRAEPPRIKQECVCRSEPSQDVACTLRVGNGRLVFYGPFAERGVELTEGNAKFNATLHSRGLGWGLREVEWVTELATTAGLKLVATVPMPADNLSIVYSRPATE
jgi:hypothetical protein